MRRSKQNSVIRWFQLSKNYTQKLLMNEFNLANLPMYKAGCKVRGCNQSCLHDIPVHRLLLWLLGCISSHLTLSSHPSYSKHFLQKISVINIKLIIYDNNFELSLLHNLRSSTSRISPQAEYLYDVQGHLSYDYSG